MRIVITTSTKLPHHHHPRTTKTKGIIMENEKHKKKSFIQAPNLEPDSKDSEGASDEDKESKASEQ